MGGTIFLQSSPNVKLRLRSKYMRAIALNKWTYNVTTKIAMTHGFIVVTGYAVFGEVYA
jgi:hypothetical protein